MKSTETITDTCNSLLRGELSAIETYTQAIQKYGAKSVGSQLERIRGDHEASAKSLRAFAGECGDESVTSSGPWGAFATAVEGVAVLIGESPALAILEQGEEHGITVYERALEDDDLDGALKDLIRDELLPAQRDHLLELKRCRSQVG